MVVTDILNTSLRPFSFTVFWRPFKKSNLSVLPVISVSPRYAGTFRPHLVGVRLDTSTLFHLLAAGCIHLKRGDNLAGKVTNTLAH
jgi:hypothetical protein